MTKNRLFDALGSIASQRDLEKSPGIDAETRALRGGVASDATTRAALGLRADHSLTAASAIQQSIEAATGTFSRDRAKELARISADTVQKRGLENISKSLGTISGTIGSEGLRHATGKSSAFDTINAAMAKAALTPDPLHPSSGQSPAELVAGAPSAGSIANYLKDPGLQASLGFTRDRHVLDTAVDHYQRTVARTKGLSGTGYDSPMREVLDQIGGVRPKQALPSPRPVREPETSAPAKDPVLPGAARPTSNFTPIGSVAEIGARVRAARKAMGMTQQRFADLAGVGRRFLIELEHGKPTLEIGRVLAVCRAAGLKLGFAD